jgi:hypothetical protein
MLVSKNWPVIGRLAKAQLIQTPALKLEFPRGGHLNGNPIFC